MVNMNNAMLNEGMLWLFAVLEAWVPLPCQQRAAATPAAPRRRAKKLPRRRAGQLQLGLDFQPAAR